MHMTLLRLLQPRFVTLKELPFCNPTSFQIPRCVISSLELLITLKQELDNLDIMVLHWNGYVH